MTNEWPERTSVWPGRGPRGLAEGGKEFLRHPRGKGKPWQGTRIKTNILCLPVARLQLPHLSASKLVRPLQDQRHELCSPHPDAFLTVTCDSAKTEL